MSQPARRVVITRRNRAVPRRTSIAVVDDSDTSSEEHGGGTEEQHGPADAPDSSGGTATASATTSTAVTPARTAVPWTRVAASEHPEQPETDATLLVPQSTGREWQLLARTPEKFLVMSLLAKLNQDLVGTVAAAKAALKSGDRDAAKVPLRKAIRIAEGYEAQTRTTANQWRAANGPAETAAIPYSQGILDTLNRVKTGYRNVLHKGWPAAYPILDWHALTQARISGQGATGVIFGYEGNQMKTVLKASTEDPLGALLLANLLHKEISGAGTVLTLDVSIDRDAITGSVVSQLQPDPPNRTAADVATMQGDFANPASTIFAFGVADGRDLKTLAQTSKPALDNAMKNDTQQAKRFWNKLGRIVAVDRFLGINDRAAPLGSNIGNIILGAAPDAITVIDNYDRNTQRDIAVNPQLHNQLLDEIGPASVGGIAAQIVADVRYQVEYESRGSKPAQPRSAFADAQLAGFLKDGIQEAIGLLAFKLVDSKTNAARIGALVQGIQQADLESSRTGQPSPGLDWTAITGRATYLKQAAAGQ